MNERLENRDQDFFENRRFESDDSERYRQRLELEVTLHLKDARDIDNADDLVAVLDYLRSEVAHDSEGRDLGYDKRSFSRTELRVAAQLPEDERVPYLVYRYRFNEYPRSHRVGRMPIILAVEPTSVCNITCTMCFQADENLSKRREMLGFMQLDLYQQIVDEAAAKGVGGIVLASRGEPLLHKQITDFVRLAKEAGIPDVKLNTNATRLNDDKIRGLLDAGLDTLVFSVDSAVKEQFERIRVGASFDQVVGNIARFNEIRSAEYPESRTRTRISMILVDDDQDSRHAAEFWKQLVDEFAVRWAIPRVQIYGLGRRPETRPCSLLWERLYIWWDGVVNTCDEDYLSTLQIGTLQVGSGPSIEEIWRSSKLEGYREMHANGKKNELSPCDKCPGF